MSKRLSIIVAILLPVLLLVLVVAMNTSGVSSEVALVERLQPSNIAQLKALPIGSEVLIEGVIDPQTIAKYRTFVAYTKASSYVDNDLSIYWGTGESIGSPLLIKLPDGFVRVVNDNYSIRNPGGVWQESGSGGASPVRYTGLRHGDQVMLVGMLTDNANEIAARAYMVAGGTRAEFMASQPFIAAPSMVLAIVALGVIIVLGVSVIIIRQHPHPPAQVSA